MPTWRTIVCPLLLIGLLSLQAGFAADDYVLGPDSLPRDGVPQGKLSQHQWNTSEVFPGTVRDYWVYVPAQYTQ